VELDYAGESNRRPALFFYDISPDKSKLLVAYVVIDKEGLALRSGFSVFDEECNVAWSEDNISSGIENKFSFSQFIIDNATNVYFAGKTNFEKKELKQGAKNEAYVILCMEKERTSVPVKIELPASKEAVGQKIEVNNNSDLYFVGTYTKNDMNNVIGLYSAKINTERQDVDNLVISDFSEDFLTKGLKDAEAKKLTNHLRKGNNFENYHYYLSDIKFLDNGSFVLGAEKGYTTYLRNRDGSSTPIYHYGDIVIANFGADASLNWIEKIPRDLDLATYPYGSYGFITNNNNVHVFYNLMKSQASILGIPPSKAKLMMYSINAEGESTWKELYDNKATKIIPRAWETIFHHTNGAILMMGHKGGNSISFTKIAID
jgi:hypothetical protein